MNIRNVCDELRIIAATGDAVEPGGIVDVPDALGVSLCEQVDVWQPIEAGDSGEED